MPSEESLDWRLTHLEDQVNRMNLVLTAQGRRIDKLSTALNRVVEQLKNLDNTEGGSSVTEGFTGLSDSPPDGSNR